MALMPDSGGWNERRLEPRFRVGLQVELNGAMGTTRDIGGSGVYFESSRGLRRGVRIRFSLVFAHEGTRGPLRVQCGGRVVRVEQLAERVGIAARILSCRIEERPPDEARNRLSRTGRR
jgi:hypothetical protein